MEEELEYIEGCIVEYDMNNAGISVLKELEYISDEMYEDLIDGGKTLSNTIIGKLKFDKDDIFEIINNNINKYVNEFIKVNKIDESNILEIAKDAIFVIDLPNKKIKTEFGEYIRITPKRTYDSMVTINRGNNKIKLYYFDNNIEVRFSKLDKDNILYDVIIDLMKYKFNGESKLYTKSIKEFSRTIKKYHINDIIKNISNEELLEVFKELSLL